jgi:hypothetical protein
MALLDFNGAPHGGSQRHLPEWESQPRMTPTTIIDHSIVGSGEGAFRHFRGTSSLESHLIVCGAADTHDGWIWQLMDTGRQADANLDANRYAISIETGDQGDPDRQPWTPNQLRSLVWLHAELRRVHPSIPNRRSRSCSDPGGHGYHTLHGAPSCWTPVAKTCPGTIRKRQWTDMLLPAYLTGSPPPEDDMTTDELLAALRSAEGKKALRAATWGGTGDEIPSVAGTLNAAQTVEVAANGVRTLENHLDAQDAAHGTQDAAIAALRAILEAGLSVNLDLANATPDQVQALAKAIADHLEVKGHPTMHGTVQLVPEASVPGGE